MFRVYIAAQYRFRHMARPSAAWQRAAADGTQRNVGASRYVADLLRAPVAAAAAARRQLGQPRLAPWGAIVSGAVRAVARGAAPAAGGRDAGRHGPRLRRPQKERPDVSRCALRGAAARRPPLRAAAASAALERRPRRHRVRAPLIRSSCLGLIVCVGYSDTICRTSCLVSVLG